MKGSKGAEERRQRQQKIQPTEREGAAAKHGLPHFPLIRKLNGVSTNFGLK